MTLEDYARNLKGVNDKADFSIEYMVRLCMFDAVLLLAADPGRFRFSERSTMAFVSAKSLCQRSMSGSSASTMLGASFFGGQSGQDHS